MEGPPRRERPCAIHTPHELSARGWTSKLAIAVSALLAILGATGLWIWLAPFSVAAELQVLAHTALGLALLLPYGIFQVRHLRQWSGQKLTAVMALGYALMALVIVCSASGIVLTFQAAAGPRRDEVWSLLHLASGAGTCALLPLHLALAWWRRRAALRQSAELARALPQFAQGAGAWLGCAALALGTATLLWPEPRVHRDLPADYSLPVYAQQFEEYQGSPFAPAYARTASGMLVEPHVLADSASCGTSGCHEEILAEWQPSAHRFSAMNPPFQAVQRLFADDRGAAETRYCAGCHDPISLFAGDKDIHQKDLSAAGMQEGVSCVVCHSIETVDQRGNADYVLRPPSKYLWEGESGLRKWLSNFLIRSYPRQHLADYDRNVLRTPEFCGACHKQFIPEALNRFGASPGQNQYDEWRQSQWHSDDPHTDLSCRDCHMRLVSDSRDPGRGEAGDQRRSAGDGKHRHHGTIATNFLMPMVLKLPHWERQVELTEEWIRGETVVPEIEHVWPSGPVATVEILAPAALEAGSEASVRVLVRNAKVGHAFTTGPLDFMQSWVHLTVEDAAGRRLAEWGALDPITRAIRGFGEEPHRIGNARDQGTLVLEGMPLDAAGQLLEKHQLWNKAGGLGVRQVYAGHSDTQLYRFQVPSDARSPLRIRARLEFRRYRQDFLDLVVPEMERASGLIQPVLTQDSDEVEVPLAPRTAALGAGAGSGR